MSSLLARFSYPTQPEGSERKKLFLRYGREETGLEREFWDNIKDMPVLYLMLEHVAEATGRDVEDPTVHRDYILSTAPPGADYKIAKLYEKAFAKNPGGIMPVPGGTVLTHNRWVADAGIISRESSFEEERACMVSAVSYRGNKGLDFATGMDVIIDDPFELIQARGYAAMHRGTAIEKLTSSEHLSLMHDAHQAMHQLMTRWSR